MSDQPVGETQITKKPSEEGEWAARMRAELIDMQLQAGEFLRERDEAQREVVEANERFNRDSERIYTLEARADSLEEERDDYKAGAEAEARGGDEARERAAKLEAALRGLCNCIDKEYASGGQPPAMDFLKIGANEVRQLLKANGQAS